MLKRFTRKFLGKSGLPDALSYEQARDLLGDANEETRTALARRQDIEPEILYYLASDDSSDVRRHVAANAHTPRHADKILTQDLDDEVRIELARKISRMLPDLDDADRARVRELTIEVIEILAQDQLPRVRQIVAEEIKQSRERAAQHRDDPRSGRRADRGGADPGIFAASQRRRPEGDHRDLDRQRRARGDRAAFVGERDRGGQHRGDPRHSRGGDAPGQSDAHIREETLDAIIDNAESIEEWHEPLSMRPSLSVRAVRRIATFVGSSLVNIMIERNKLPDEVGEEITRKVRSRIEAEEGEERSGPGYDFEKLVADGKLDGQFICDLIDNGRRVAVTEALATLAKIPAARVKDILESRNGMVITSLCWRAGLTMRTALRLQSDFAYLKSDQIVNAKNGVDYPLKPEEMDMHLSFFAE